MRWVLLVLAVGCVHSNTIECANGEICPGDRACDDVHGACVEPKQLELCSGLSNGDACWIDADPSSAADGICDRGVCITEGCGDGYIRGGEQCDPLGNVVPDDADCTDLNFYVSSKPTCTNDCTFDRSSCAETCGDGTVQPKYEICEVGIEPTASCIDYGFGAGTLSCLNCGPGTDDCIPFGWKNVNVGGLVTMINGTASDDVYAVALTQQQLHHFDGISWTGVDLSGCNLTSAEALERVWEPTPGVVFAEGGDAVIRIMNGGCTKWVIPGGHAIVGLVATSATDAWVAVQTDGIWRFDGTSWTSNLVLDGSYYALWASGPLDVYATSSADAFAVHHYNGTWSTIGSATTGISDVVSIWGSSSSDVYMGSASSGTIVRFNGAGWSTSLDQSHPILAPATAHVGDGAAVGGRTYAVVNTDTPNHTYVMMNDGTGWTQLDAPLPGQAALWVAPTGEIFAGVLNTGNIALMRGSLRIDKRPGLPGTYASTLAARAADDIYAVLDDASQLVHWDGASWAFDADVTIAQDVDVSPTGTVFAANAFPTETIYKKTVGGTWSSFTNGGGGRLAILSDTDVWMIDPLSSSPEVIERWHSGSSVTTLNYLNANTERMLDIWASPGVAVFVVGTHDAGQPTAAIERYDLTTSTWQTMTPPANILTLVRVWGRTATDVYAVSQDGLLIHYDGTSWSTVAGIAQVNDVWGSPSDLFATTYNGLEHFDGTRWDAVATGATLGTTRLTGIGASVVFADSFGDWHQLVRLAPWPQK